MRDACPECGSKELYTRGDVGLRSGYGPDLLPELGTFFLGPKASVVICQDCGLIRFYADEKARSKLPGGNRWRKLK